MPRQEIINVYKFDELGAKAKEKARDWFRQITATDDWWANVYEEAAELRIKITGFHLNGRQIDLHLTKDPDEVARLVVERLGPDEDAAKVAHRHLIHRRALSTLAEKQRDLEANLGRSLLNQLEREYDYQQSNENVDETIRANDYDFYASGERCTSFGG